MELDPAICYRAVQARDARYDGRFFMCVKTTGVYCRPICPARPPKFEHCRFVPTAAAAQAASFRPCLRCRPENSPDLDSTEATVSRAMKLIDAGALDEGNVAELAERLGIGERQLRRLFSQHVGATPLAVARTRRVLLAKQLIHQTGLSMIEVALASGFGSVRQFNETFRRMYGRQPRELRHGPAHRVMAPQITIFLPYRPPYDWQTMLRFLKGRAIPGVESVTDDTYSRTIAIDGMIGMIHVSHAAEQSSLRVEVQLPRLNSLANIISRIRRQFDLAADPRAIESVLARDPLLAPLVLARPGLRVPGGWDGFEIAVRAVLGQQITVRGGITLAARVVANLGPSFTEPIGPGLTHLFPPPECFDESGLGGLGIPKARIRSLVHVARACMNNERWFDPGRDLADTIARFKSVPGIGEWTAQYIAMRAVGESDAFLAADVGLQRRCLQCGQRASPTELLARAESWRPWRAYATLHLWMADDKSDQRSTD